jgi:hypothetical protein
MRNRWVTHAVAGVEMLPGGRRKTRVRQTFHAAPVDHDRILYGRTTSQRPSMVDLVLLPRATHTISAGEPGR